MLSGPRVISKRKFAAPACRVDADKILASIEDEGMSQAALGSPHPLLLT